MSSKAGSNMGGKNRRRTRHDKDAKQLHQEAHALMAKYKMEEKSKDGIMRIDDDGLMLVGHMFPDGPVTSYAKLHA